jgi:hypothetical protein
MGGGWFATFAECRDERIMYKVEKSRISYTCYKLNDEIDEVELDPRSPHRSSPQSNQAK